MWIKWFIWTVLYIYSGFIQSSGAEDLIPCKEGWFYFRDNCYKIGGKIETERLNLTQALAKCDSEGGNLATIQSKELQDFLVTFLLMDAKTDAWIGLNDLADRNIYVWADGSAINFINWRPNKRFPPHEEWAQCVEMAFVFYSNRDGLTGQWNDLMCSDLKAYICQAKPSNKSSPDPRFCSGPQGGWKHQNTCYHIVSEKKSWDDAEQHCQDQFNGHLLTVLDFAVDVFVENILSNMEVWIGIKIQEQSLQRWASGWFVSYSEWDNDGEQDFILGTCAVRSKYKLWKKVPCSSTYSFICEAPSVAPPVLKQPVNGSKCPNLPGNWWDLGGEYCYLIENGSKVNWCKANMECIRRGASLASIHSEEESVILQQFIKYTQINLHIGLLRHVEPRLAKQNVFVWADGSPMDYKNWNFNEPNTDHELCGDIWTETMKWYDASCDSETGYICSVRKVSPNATEQVDSSSGVLSQIAISVSISIILAIILIGCFVYFVRTRRIHQEKISSGVQLEPALPSSPRPNKRQTDLIANADNDYYENMS